MIGRAIWVKYVNWNARKQKRPPKSSKNQMFILDYVQLLMISWVIWARNVDWNAKKWKRPPKSSKNKMLIFGLHSTSDDWPSNPSKKGQLKCRKNKKGPLSHWKIKCLFLDYIQLLMISRAIQIKNVNRNYKKPRMPSKSLKNQMFIFGLHSTSDEQLSDLSEKHWLKCKKIKKAP